MIERLVAFCARNRVLVIMVVATLTAYGVACLRRIPVDAIPDLSDTQVIVYSRWDRSPDILEDQVTYPIVSSLLGAPRVKTIRGFSDYGFSYVYVIFEDGTDLYWARSRVLEYLSKILPRLPDGVRTELGPDATGVGWVYQYAIVDDSGTRDLAEVRAFQDWNLRYHLQSVQGVAEVAGFGGFQKQYQVAVDPNALAALSLSIDTVVQAVRESNEDAGGRLLEIGGAEFMVSGRGYLKGVEDLEQVLVGTSPAGTPLRVKDVATVSIGPEIRRGVGDLDGLGEAVGGIVVMRHGENALTVVDRVKAKLAELEPSLPRGLRIVSTYDRSVLIRRAQETLWGELGSVMATVSLVILLFLWHIPSALIPILTLPVAVLLSFIPMSWMGIPANIMSLGGIAVAIGAMVDAAIVVVENSHKRLEEWEAEGRPGSDRDVIVRAIQEVARPAFYSLLVIAVAFVPIFALEEQEGRLFKPLAFTKNLSIAVAAVLAITLDPAIRLLLTRRRPFAFRPRPLAAAANAVLVGRMLPEERHPVSRALFRLYEPAARAVLRFPKATIALALAIVAATVPVFFRIGSEFMPPLNEGTILYMPTTLPGISVTEASRLLQIQDRVLRAFPEVVSVHGKAGRADTPTDPAPFSMMETVVTLRPEDEWRPMRRFYSGWIWPIPQVLRRIFPDRITWDELVNQMDRALRIPGTTNAWTMPIKNRIDMLTTGVRTPIGIKVSGADLAEIERIGERVEVILRDVPGTRSVFAERTTGGYFVNVHFRREDLARYGLTVARAEAAFAAAVGGETATTTIEGRERYPVLVRYPREIRDDVDRLRSALVSTPSGAHVPIEAIADVRRVPGPAMIRNENGLLAGYVYVDYDAGSRDLGSYVEDAKRAVEERLTLPAGYTLAWSGQYEAIERVRGRLSILVPITLALVVFLVWLNTGSLAKTGIVFLAVPFSAVGAIWLVYLLDYNFSIAVWVGLIALLGVDAETGVFMLLYLDLAYDEARRKGRLRDAGELQEAIVHGAVRRVRPKFMTVFTDVFGLLPILWALGTGADVMKRIAAPYVGGLVTSFFLELLVYPAIYLLWKRRSLPRG